MDEGLDLRMSHRFSSSGCVWPIGTALHFGFGVLHMIDFAEGAGEEYTHGGIGVARPTPGSAGGPGRKVVGKMVEYRSIGVARPRRRRATATKAGVRKVTACLTRRALAA
jgi:hypothetical protein